jgi:hypothetical protein
MTGAAAPKGRRGGPAEPSAEHSLAPAARETFQAIAARLDRLQRPLCIAGLAGLALATFLGAPGNPFIDVSLRREQVRYQLVGMLLSHASVLLLLAGLYPSRQRLLELARRGRASGWLGGAAVASLVIGVTWVTLYRQWPQLTTTLARESGPVEPIQTGLYVIASWLAWQCARRAARPDEERLYRVANIAFAWLALEEVEFFGIFEMLIGGRIHGVWVRGGHDFIALALRVPAVRAALIGVALLLVAVAIWYVGPRGVLRQLRSLAVAPAALAVLTLVLSQTLDQDNAALVAYSRVLAYRLEEPLELIGALMMNVALVIKYGEMSRRRKSGDGRGERI